MVIIAAILAAALTGLSWLMAHDRTVQIDTNILRYIHAHSSVDANLFFSMITNLGDPLLLLPVGLIAVCILIRQNSYARAVIVTVLFVGIGLLTGVLKTVFDRARPDLWPHTTIETSFSFPSGHAATSMILALTLIWLVPRARKILWISLLSIYVLLVSFSRPYLGVHYPSDILGGWLLAALWFVIVMSVCRKWVTYRNRRTSAATEHDA